MHYLNVGHDQMALQAAIQGNVALFDAILEHAEVDPKKLERFESFGDHHMHDTFFLIYEVVSRGHVSMYKRLRELDFSLVVLEDLYAEVADEKQRKEAEDAATRARGEHVTMVADASYWYMRQANPYKAPSLLAYAKRMVDEYDASAKEAANKKRRIKRAIAAQDAIIADRSYDQKKYDAYVEAKFSPKGFVGLLFDNPRAMDDQKPRSVPLYDALYEKARLEGVYAHTEKERLAAVARRKNVRELVPLIEEDGEIQTLFTQPSVAEEAVAELAANA